jgi:putative ABC transport system ATP-binding protein
MSLIQIKNLQKVYKSEGVETVALEEATFNIAKGEFVAIMGPSGSGKSTLMHIIGFLDRPSSGQYLFKDKNILELSEKEMAQVRNQDIGFVFQSFNLLPRTSVFENIRLPLIYSKVSAAEQKNKVLKAVKSVNLEHRVNYLSNQLSGGEKQRVAIARALVNDPDLILADEPTGNLDSKTGGQIMQILQRLNDEGKTIIMVTHETETAEHAKRIIYIRDGAVVRDYVVDNRRLMKNGGELKK